MKRVVIYVPGLNDTLPLNITLTNFLPFLWRIHNMETYIFRPHWKKGNYQLKLSALLQLIDKLYRKDTAYILLDKVLEEVLFSMHFRKEKIKLLVLLMLEEDLRREYMVFR